MCVYRSASGAPHHSWSSFTLSCPGSPGIFHFLCLCLYWIWQFDASELEGLFCLGPRLCRLSWNAPLRFILILENDSIIKWTSACVNIYPNSDLSCSPVALVPCSKGQQQHLHRHIPCQQPDGWAGLHERGPSHARGERQNSVSPPKKSVFSRALVSFRSITLGWPLFFDAYNTDFPTRPSTQRPFVRAESPSSRSLNEAVLLNSLEG